MELDITLKQEQETPNKAKEILKHNPPNFLMTTPESFILMLSWETSKVF